MDNGKEFTDHLFGLRKRAATCEHEFDKVCADLDIERRPTPPKLSLQTNGMVEQFNGQIEDRGIAFGLIDAASIRRKHGMDGRLLWCEVELSNWVFNAIQAQEVLTLHKDYFRLRKPIERRVYEIARKHCGRQSRVRMH